MCATHMPLSPAYFSSTTVEDQKYRSTYPGIPKALMEDAEAVPYDPDSLDHCVPGYNGTRMYCTLVFGVRHDVAITAYECDGEYCVQAYVRRGDTLLFLWDDNTPTYCGKQIRPCIDGDFLPLLPHVILFSREQCIAFGRNRPRRLRKPKPNPLESAMAGMMI